MLLKKYWMPIIIEGKNDKLEEKTKPTSVTSPNPDNAIPNSATTDSTSQPTTTEQELEHIPHQPSQFITTILYEICLEIQRAHGQIIGHVFLLFNSYSKDNFFLLSMIFVTITYRIGYNSIYYP